MLILPDAWTWDFWVADDGARFHLFFLRASRALLHPDRRHRLASVGHAVSTDLREWTLLADAVVPSDPPAFDDLATWTGSVIQAPDGTWRMFYTGISQADGGMIQRISSAVSHDLTVWQPPEGRQILEADLRWYESADLGPDTDRSDGVAWRDPWVFADPDGNGWHMLITARAREGEALERGTVGHAHSDDLARWRVLEPLSKPGGFGQLEVMQVAEVEGRVALLFSCLAGEMHPGRREPGERAGVWSVAAESPTGPFDLTRARPLTGPDLYSGRLVTDRSGTWNLLAFQNQDESGAFVGGLTDPIPVGWRTGPDGVPHLGIR
jgi:beta-fructofuranosidase